MDRIRKIIEGRDRTKEIIGRNIGFSFFAMAMMEKIIDMIDIKIGGKKNKGWMNKKYN